MSLKAKIEAVIYASEEPVTLAQLTGLLGEEGQVELNALAAQQQSLALEDEVAADGDDAQTEPVENADALNAEPIPEPGAPGLASETWEVATTESQPAIEPGAPGLASETWEGAATESQPAIEPGAPGLASETWEGATTESQPAIEPGAPGLASETWEGAATESTNEKKLARAAAAETKARERKLRDYFRSLLEELIADYANGDRGLEIREVAGGFRLGTKAEYHDAVRGFVKSLKPPLKLTLQALETLAVVAYKQPVTAPEVSEIRGVDSAGVLGSLLARKLVTTAGRKQVIGRPILYKTTKDFLLRFGLKDINELPSIEEFEKMAGELNETLLDQALETEAQEEIPMEAPEHRPDESFDDAAPGDGGGPSVDEGNAAPEPTNILHKTPEDLLSDKSAHLEGHNREHADKAEVNPQASDPEATSDVECHQTDETPDDPDA